MKSLVAAFTTLTLSVFISLAAEPTDYERYSQAQKLEREGNPAGAFLEYLSIPGAEHSAAALARSAPDKYLPLLESADAPTPVIQLIKGDLLLAKGDREGALAYYRATAASIAKDYNTGWKDDHVPWNYFFVEPHEPKQALGKPFENSVGTQRDNWLIRRFIELDAMDDAEREFKRIHQLQQHDAQPHIETWMTISRENGQITPPAKPFLTQINGDDELSLRFALDYADFLQQREQKAAALSMLLPPLLIINLDKSPGSYQGSKQLTEEESKQYPPKARGDDLPYHRVYIPSVGASREEFIRSVVEAHDRAGKMDELLTALNEEINRGNNAARLTLAQIMDSENALELELAYIREAEFNPASKTYRRGLLYEAHQKFDQAAAEYEALLAMNPSGGANLPYEYSDITVGQRTDTTPKWARNLPHWSSLTYKEIIPRLQRIYTTQGKTDRVLELSLFQFDRIPGALADLYLLMNTAERHAAEGKTAEFYTWTETQAAQETNLTAKANLYWAMNHPEQTLAVLADAKKTEQLQVWKSHFKNKSPKLLAKLLDLSIALDPTDSLTRMEKLELQPEPLTPEAIDTLERLLAPDAKSPFPRGKGTYTTTRFRNEYDLTYRLMQLYEKENRIDDLTALGKRVALGETPFESMDRLQKETYTSSKLNQISDDLNAILSLLIHYADPRTLHLLSETWSTAPDFPAKRQLERKQRGGFETSTTAAIPWANLPEGVTALVSSENVLSLSADEHYAYSGHPWGLAVYDHEGNAVTRIALGTAALIIEACGEKVWVGTLLGLYSIDPKTWSIALLPMNQDLAEWERDLDELSPSYYNGIYALAADDESLWIGTSRDIRRLDLKTETLRIFSERELGQKSQSSWNKIWIEEKRVWAGGHDGTVLFDRATETWSILLYQDAPVHITNNTKEPLSGYIALKATPYKQPCTIDRKTLEITLAQGTVYSTTEKRRFEITLHNGAQLLGKKHEDAPLYQYPNEDKPFATTTQREIDSGGLFYIPPNGEPKRISSRAAVNSIPSDIVFSVAPALEENRLWLCGDSGISLMDSQGHVLENIQRADGLPASRVTTALSAEDNTYFALDSKSNRMILSKDSNIFRLVSPTDDVTPPLSLLEEQNEELHRRHASGSPPAKNEPLLGGFVVSTTKNGNTTMICGTRGLLIVSDSAVPTLKTKELVVNVQMDEAKNLAAEAQALKIERRISLERFKELLNHENPFVIAEAFGSAAFSEAVLQSRDFPVLAEKYLSNPEPRVRSTAFYALTRCSQDDAVIPILKNALQHSDNYLRAVATINLCKRAILPPIKNVQEVFDEDDLYGDYPFGAISTIGTEASRQQLIEAVVPLATPEIFSMLIEHPPSIGDYWNETRVYPPLSEALLRHPEAAYILLSATDTKNNHHRRNFAMNLFKLSGTNMLASLHIALQSENEVVRSNAARACGAIGDSSSIEPLLAAWEMNSEFSRTSIVWALGELNATKAVPLLEQAYIDIRLAIAHLIDERLQRNAGNTDGNSVPIIITTTTPPPLAPAEDIIKALNKIDPSATQNFYRNLAADEDWSARNTAAKQLAYAPDKTVNIAILRLLLADEYESIQMSAAASLLILGDRSAEPYFLKWLSDEKQSTRTSALQQLIRVESPEALAFAQDAIEKSVSSTDSYEIDLATDLLKRLETEYPSHIPL